MLVADDQVFGIALINYDQSALASHRCYIRSLCTIFPAHLAKALDCVVDFIWKKLNCDHIRVEINHFVDSSGKVNVDAHVKSVYTSKGFKWKTLQNDPSGKRA
jgi:hypothetical protein